MCPAGAQRGGCSAWAPSDTSVPPSSFAEQLVLYLKVASSCPGLQTAIDQIRAGKLCLSSTVKQGGECGWPGLPAGPGRRPVFPWGRQEGEVMQRPQGWAWCRPHPGGITARGWWKAKYKGLKQGLCVWGWEGTVCIGGAEMHRRWACKLPRGGVRGFLLVGPHSCSQPELQGPLSPAVVRKLNELYKTSVVSQATSLSLRLQRFLDKQRPLDPHPERHC